MQYSSLSKHKFKKGKFITPFNDQLGGLVKENSWYHVRLPEYVWLGLVLKHYGREVGLKKCIYFIKKASENNISLTSLRMSTILSLPNENQILLYNLLDEIIKKETISPLTAIFTYSGYPCFASFFSTTLSVDKKVDLINEVLEHGSDHQSDFSTDLRFLVIYHLFITNKLHIIDRSMVEALLRYPTLSHDNEEMRIIRPSIRAFEIALIPEVDNDYLNYFWEGLSKMSECELKYLKIDPDHNNTEKYLSKIKEILQYYTKILTSVCPLNNRMLVILGIATYSYKRLLEVVEHDLYQTIAGRGVVRVLIENYIMLKYLIKNESSHENIWEEYQYYGIGQYKIISERYLELGVETNRSHVMYDYIDSLVGEYRNKEFIDMDTSYFDSKSVREKAIEVDEKNLFGLYYDYDSAFEHGLWGAIRESSLLKCCSPSHQYHCVPDIDNNQKMKDIWNDCVETMDKIIGVLKTEYGLPDYFDEDNIDD